MTGPLYRDSSVFIALQRNINLGVGFKEEQRKRTAVLLNDKTRKAVGTFPSLVTLQAIVLE